MPRELERASRTAVGGVGLRFDWKQWGPLWALILLIALGAWINPNFLSGANITNVLSRSAFTGIIAVGATFVIIAGGIDLSVGSMAAFISGIMIVAMNRFAPSLGTGWSVVLLGMGLSLLSGLLAGLINGLLTTKGKIEAFIVTLGTMGIYRSLVTYLADGGTLSLNFGISHDVPPRLLRLFMVHSLPRPHFRHRRFAGRPFAQQDALWPLLPCHGSNEHVARYSAIDVDRIRTMTYVLQGICVAIATIIYVPRLGSRRGRRAFCGNWKRSQQSSSAGRR